jgi:tyrosine-specific transport protein
MHIVHHFGHIVGGTLLIAATTIGVGMLGMPIATAPGGFIPSLFTFVASWLFMLCTGLLFLEVCSWMPKDSSFITMSAKLLGPFGKGVCWVFYLFFFYALMVAHIVSGGDILNDLSMGTIPSWASPVIYLLLFTPVVYLGTQTVDRINLVLMGGLAITYILFITIASQYIDKELLKHMNWLKAWCATPVLFTAFAFQFIIPTLVTYMERDFRKVRIAIIAGSSIPCIIYLLWEFTILGVVPLAGTDGLAHAGQVGDTAIAPLRYVLVNPYLFEIGKYFAFFTMTVSFIALSIAFLDFLADGLKVKKSHGNKFWLLMLVGIPPLVFALTYPEVFSLALRYAGGFSIAVLYGLLPCVMVWAGRYVKKYHKMPQALFGGKAMLSVLIVLASAELLLDLFVRCS